MKDGRTAVSPVTSGSTASSPLLQDGWKVKTRLVLKCEVQKGRRASPECYSLESGLKSASRPSCSLVSKSLSGFGFLKSDGRFRMCTSFLNCWHRAVCRRGDRVGGETGIKHSQLADNGHVELQHTFPNAAGRVPPPSAAWRYRHCCALPVSSRQQAFPV